mmetsp:Transcript_7986/g.29538  ORF Transcript_7986/g.29538 Transcript_7986/m.29538 type:complete len:331 (+) Transcript_7986:541-1533(+)
MTTASELQRAALLVAGQLGQLLGHRGVREAQELGPADRHAPPRVGLVVDALDRLLPGLRGRGAEVLVGGLVKGRDADDALVLGVRVGHDLGLVPHALVRVVQRLVHASRLVPDGPDVRRAARVARPLGLDMAQVVDHDGAGLERAGAQLHVFEDGVARVPRLHGLQARALRQLAVHGLERHVAEGVAVAVVAPVALAAVGVDLVLVVQSLLVTVVVRVAVALGARSRALGGLALAQGVLLAVGPVLSGVVLAQRGQLLVVLLCCYLAVVVDGAVAAALGGAEAACCGAVVVVVGMVELAVLLAPALLLAAALRVPWRWLLGACLVVLLAI